MPYKCCVPKCHGNYTNGPKVSTFSFPKNETLRKKWLKAICREDFSPTNSTKVCQLHFRRHEIELETSEYTDEGKKLTARLRHPRLIEGAVPSQFPNCPQYLSKTDNINREEPEAKRRRIESARIQEAIESSLQTAEEHKAKNTFHSVNELMGKLDKVDLDGWVVQQRREKLWFFYITDNGTPDLKCSVVITDNLNLSVFCGGAEIKSLCGIVNDLIELEKRLGQAYKLIEDPLNNSTKNNLNLVIEVLQTLLQQAPTRKSNIEFLIEQVKLMDVSNKTRLRYSWELMLFCALVHSISPHAYKFIRHSGNLTLPSSSTIRRICSSFSTDPHLEQSDATFLQYIKSKFKLLNPSDKLVVLMLDEIHIKPYMDFKGGNIVGGAYNNEDLASSAHTFMINSLLSSYKDVVHILPVKKMDAKALHAIVNKTIIGLENIGFEVLAVVSDNNSLNRKTMSLFSDPPQFLNEYKHPKDPARPLFYAVDSVHILKCIRNNWLNQKPSPYMKFPDFEDDSLMRLASFGAIREMYSAENQHLLKHGYNLTLKALYPTSIERQNVKLALKIFNPQIANALRELGPRKYFESYEDTAEYIAIICRWWRIVNVKTLLKGQRLKDSLQEPMRQDSEHLKNLCDYVKWLDRWEKYNGDGKLTDETHYAFKSTTECLIKMAKYCFEKKGFTFFLCGKIQTDKLEARFGDYRAQAGSQYHVSIRQVYESEAKLRLQSVVPLILKSQQFGNVQITKEDLSDFVKRKPKKDTHLIYENVANIPEDIRNTCFVDDENISDIKEELWPLLTYIAGYASYAIMKNIKCNYCREFLTAEHEYCKHSSVISANDRGGLSYPSEDIVICAAYSYIIIGNILSDCENIFLKQSNPRQILAVLVFETLGEQDVVIFQGHNCPTHKANEILQKIVIIMSNILLNNFCKKRNDFTKTKTMPQCKRMQANKKK